MILIEFDEATDPRELLLDGRSVTWLSDSIGWDLRLPYVRREIGECRIIRTKAEALEAQSTGSSS